MLLLVIVAVALVAYLALQIYSLDRAPLVTSQTSNEVKRRFPDRV